MRLIATNPEENALIADLANELREKGTYVDLTNYEDGFGFTVWSVDDLQNFSATLDWPQEEKIRFMESIDHKIGGATDDGWAILRARIEQFVNDRKDTNTAYVVKNYAEFEKIKFYTDVCGSGWIRMAYYNPDSNAGGQLVYDLLPDHVISEASSKCASDEDFWNHLHANAKQTSVDINKYSFAGAAKEFVESPCDCFNQGDETIKRLKQWAETSLSGNGGHSDE